MLDYQNKHTKMGVIHESTSCLLRGLLLKMAELDNLLRIHGVRKETLKHVVREEYRNEIAKKIGGDWESLATFTRVPHIDVNFFFFFL